MLDETLAITSKDSRQKTSTHGDLRVLVFLEDLGPAQNAPGAIGSAALASALNYADEAKAAYETIPVVQSTVTPSKSPLPSTGAAPAVLSEIKNTGNSV